ncbi:MAG: NTP transferase domain-containing protein [Planctomycetes bacterium]|nr:NTP transferase domain-containing protein [Planctomycetota bacterium]
MKPALVILAAGASERLGEPKALCRFGAHTALERLLAAGREVCDGAPLVVVGAHAEAIALEAPHDVELACHTEWRRGRTSSIRLARRLRRERDLLLAPIDVPLVARATFEALLAAWLAAGSPERGWLAPRLDVAGPAAMKSEPPERPSFGTLRRHGHPVLVGRALALELELLSDSEPLSRLRDRARPCFDVGVADLHILDDLDSPEDLDRMRRELARDAQV